MDYHLTFGAQVHAASALRLEELLKAAHFHKKCIQRLCAAIGAARGLTIYLSQDIAAYLLPTRSWYIPDFMNFFRTTGTVTLATALPVIQTIWPDWHDAPPTLETVVCLLAKMYHARDLKRLADNVEEIVRFKRLREG